MPRDFASLDLTGSERRAILERLLDVIDAETAVMEIRIDATRSDEDASRLEAQPIADRHWNAPEAIGNLIDRAVTSARVALSGARAIEQRLAADAAADPTSAYWRARLDACRISIATLEEILRRRAPDTAELVAACA